MSKSASKKIKNLNDIIFISAIVVPVIIYFAVFVYYPFIMNIFYMFCDYNYLKAPTIIGMKNLIHLFSDNLAWESIRNTLVFTIFSVPFVIALSILLSTFLFYLKIGKQFLRSMIFTTFLPNWIIGAIIFKQWFSTEGGIVNYTLQCLKLPAIPWLSEPFWAIIAIIILNIWVFLGYYVVIFLAGISNINSELFEASKIDGANNIKTFFYVTLPQLAPTIIFSTITAAINYLRTYPQVVVLTNGGPSRSTQSALMYMFSTGFTSRNVGYASVLAVTLFIIILVVTFAQMKATKFYSE
jgi:ABC-type sugar transport system permease subunit